MKNHPTGKPEKKPVDRIVSIATMLAGLMVISVIVNTNDSQAFECCEYTKPKPGFRLSKSTRDETNQKADHIHLRLSRGEERIVDLDYETSAQPKFTANSDPKLVLAQVVELDGKANQISFKPLDAGNTTVSVRDLNGAVRTIFHLRIDPTNLFRVARELRYLFRDIEGLTCTIRNGKVFLDGEVLVPEDYSRILGVLEGKNTPYAEDIVNLVTLSPVALQVMARKIQSEINEFAPNVSVRVVNKQFWLEGNVDDPAKGARSEKIARLYLPSIAPGTPLEGNRSAKRLEPPIFPVQNFIINNPQPPQRLDKLLRITVNFVELNKNFAKFFAFKWAPGIATGSDQITLGASAGGAAGATTGAGSFTATISNLFPTLSSAKNAGFARIFKTANVIVRSGQAANITDKRQFPIQSLDAEGRPVFDTRDVGLDVKVRPQIVGQTNDIEMQIDLSQSNVVDRVGTNVITTDQTINTLFYVKSNESAAVGGINTNQIQTDYNKDDPSPGSFASDDGGDGGNAGANPSVGPLFNLLRSKNYVKTNGQFVVFVTPEIIENASEGSKELKRNFRIKVD